MSNKQELTQKKFLDEAKRYKRKNHLTADEARDEVATKYGASNYVELCHQRNWKA